MHHEIIDLFLPLHFMITFNVIVINLQKTFIFILLCIKFLCIKCSMLGFAYFPSSKENGNLLSTKLESNNFKFNLLVFVEYP